MEELSKLKDIIKREYGYIKKGMSYAFGPTELLSYSISGGITYMLLVGVQKFYDALMQNYGNGYTNAAIGAICLGILPPIV